jgi:hypothetical protein
MCIHIASVTLPLSSPLRLLLLPPRLELVDLLYDLFGPVLVHCLLLLQPGLLDIAQLEALNKQIVII